MSKTITMEVDSRLQRKISLAQQRGTRVMLVRTNDTHIVLDITRQADRVLNYLRRNLLIKFNPEDVVPLLRKYNEAVKALHEATYELCKFAGVEYRPPKGFEIPLDEETKRGIEEFKKEKKAEILEQVLIGDGRGDGKGK